MSIRRQYFVDLFLAKGLAGAFLHNTGAPSDALPMPRVIGAQEVSPDYLEVLLTYKGRGLRRPRVNPLALWWAVWQTLFTSPRIEPCLLREQAILAREALSQINKHYLSAPYKGTPQPADNPKGSRSFLLSQCQGTP